MAVDTGGLLDRAKGGARQFYNGFTSGQKAVTLAALGAVIVGAVVLSSMSGKPTYATLFTNLQPQDAASITGKLSSQKVPYKLTDGGATVQVPAGDVNQERINLAQAGLPATTSAGLSILDKEGLTTSNMTQQADYLRALQGELEQTIDSISGVQTAQVNIALPANQDFALNNNGPTGASIMVSLQPGQTLSSGTVQAIVHLVGSSVPNLDSKNVTVADSSGNLLAGPGVAMNAAGGDAQTNSYDSATQQKVETYLASVVGQGNADVQVNATLDYDQVSTTTNSLVTGKNGQAAGYCTQSSNDTQTYTGSGTPTGGTAGTITQVSGSGTGTYKHTTTSQTCEASTSTQTVQQAPGSLKNQQVAVLIDANAIPKGTNLQALKAGVAAAAGINSARGDQLAFSSMPFNTTGAKQAAAAAKAAAAANQKKAQSSLMKTAALTLVIGLTLLLLWRSAKKARKRAGEVQLLSPEDIEAMRGARALERPNPLPLSTPAVAELANSREAAEVNAFIDAQPEEVASMLRTWLNPAPARSQA